MTLDLTCRGGKPHSTISATAALLRPLSTAVSSPDGPGAERADPVELEDAAVVLASRDRARDGKGWVGWGVGCRLWLRGVVVDDEDEVVDEDAVGWGWWSGPGEGDVLNRDGGITRRRAGRPSSALVGSGGGERDGERESVGRRAAEDTTIV